MPSCPDWDAADLLWHLAEVQWFWARTVRTRPAAPEDDLVHPTRPGTYDGLLAAFDEHSASLVAELEAADPTEEAWHWAPTRTVGTSYRRQAHEALVHRLDAEQTAGAVTPLDPALAADGVHEALDLMYGGEPPAWATFAPSRLVRVDLTDVHEQLWVRTGALDGSDPGSGRVLEGPHLVLTAAGEADAVVSGTAATLDAWLWHRADDTAITTSGDPAAHAELVAAVSPPID